MDEMLKRNKAKAIVIQIFQLETQEDFSIPRAGIWTLSHWPEDSRESWPERAALSRAKMNFWAVNMAIFFRSCKYGYFLDWLFHILRDKDGFLCSRMFTTKRSKLLGACM